MQLLSIFILVILVFFLKITVLFQGVMVPPVLADITNDGTVDIIMAMFNTTVVAIDGETYDIIWKATFPGSESYV